MAEVDLGSEWVEILDRLDRHVTSAQPSPDTVSLRRLMETYRVPGVSIAVGREDGQIWSAQFGVAAIDGPTPLAAGTSFQACSISKHVAAFGALRMVANGSLDLDADIHDYLTSWHLPATDGWQPRVTVRQLLAHTAGLSYNWFRGYPVDEPAPAMLQILDGTAPANTPPVRPRLLPGSRFRYSGSHYAVLQQLMVDVAGGPFDELMRALVLQPLGMTDSSFDLEFPRQRPRLTALGHHTGGTPVPGGWHANPEMAGAGLWSTPTDLLRLELEILRATSGKSGILSQELATQMVTPQLPNAAYGLGTELDDSAEHRRFGHTGSNVGYNCFCFVWPGAGTGLAVMINSDDAQDILLSVLAAADRRYATDEHASPPTDVTGQYLLRDGYTITLTAADGRLTLSAPGQAPAVLQPLPTGYYRHPALDLEVRFRRTDGQAYTVELRQEGVTQTATPA